MWSTRHLILSPVRFLLSLSSRTEGAQIFHLPSDFLRPNFVFGFRSPRLVVKNFRRRLVDTHNLHLNRLARQVVHTATCMQALSSALVDAVGAVAAVNRDNGMGWASASGGTGQSPEMQEDLEC